MREGFYDDMVKVFGAAALADKNGKPLTGGPLDKRVEKLEAARLEAEHANKTVRKDDFDMVDETAAVERTTEQAPAPALTPNAKRFAVEKNVPMPERSERAARSDTKYPFADMTEEGDSFFVPSTEGAEKPWKTLSSLCSRMSEQLFPATFQAIRVNTPEVGCRVYRVANRAERREKRVRPAKKAAE